MRDGGKGFPREGARVAPTFGRLCDAIGCRAARPNAGAARPCEARRVNLLRERTDNRPW
jgi:hypothetical protein